MTKRQREVLDTIRANGGYACLNWGTARRWFCAKVSDYGFLIEPPELPSRVMNALMDQGRIQSVGSGYGHNSFWEVAPELLASRPAGPGTEGGGGC